MKKKAEILFIWDASINSTDIYTHSNNKSYQIRGIKFKAGYRIELFEDDYSIAITNTSIDTFLKIVDVSSPIETQILQWGKHLLIRHMGTCDLCKESKFINKLSRNDLKKDEFVGLKKLCKKCRSGLYDKIYAKILLESKEKDKLFVAELDKNPPQIIGGFKKKIDAYKIINQIENPDLEDLGDGFVFVKSILKASNGTYYPVFCTIGVDDGGELWDTDFIAYNTDNTIPQHLVFNYIGKTEDEIFPYEYETLSHIEGDFHQKSWFGPITQKSVKHHFNNQITIQRSNDWESVEDTTKVEVRSYFSIQHILSSTFLLTQLLEYEKNLSVEKEDHLINHRSLIVAIIMACVSFLEATINELYMDSSENPNGIVKDLNKSAIKMLSKMWKKGIPRTASYTVLEKYQIALSLSNKRELDLGGSLCQNISALVKLRNALVHFEPESVVTKSLNESSTIKRQKLEQQLKGKFKENQYTGVDNPYFPDKCLSTDCALWALKSSLNFTDTFFSNLGILPTYQRIKYKISPLLSTSPKLK